MLKLKKTQRKFKKSEKGMALIESIPVLFMLVMVFNFSLGFFGAIHSGILNSIGSYNYALETFRFRSNLMYFRPGVQGEPPHYEKSRNRVHGVIQDGSTPTANEEKNVWPATVRAISFNYKKDDTTRGLANVKGDASSVCDDNTCRNFSSTPSGGNIWGATSNYVPEEGSAILTPRIWVKTVYGICLNAECEK